MATMPSRIPENEPATMLFDVTIRLRVRAKSAAWGESVARDEMNRIHVGVFGAHFAHGAYEITSLASPRTLKRIGKSTPAGKRGKKA